MDASITGLHTQDENLRDLRLALELANLADVVTVERFRAADLVVETKPDLTPVSEADRAVEQLLRKRVGEERPDHAVLGEEFGIAGGDGSQAATRWIIDPIDGTKNYVRGIPVYATLIALERATAAWWSAWSPHPPWAGDGGPPGAPARSPTACPLRVSKVAAVEDAQLGHSSVSSMNLSPCSPAKSSCAYTVVGPVRPRSQSTTRLGARVADTAPPTRSPAHQWSPSGSAT
jgi:Inositol monophosphatase family